MANGGKLYIATFYTTWSSSLLYINRLLLAHTHTQSLSLVAFSGEKGIFQSRIVRKTILRNVQALGGRYIFYTVMSLAFAFRMLCTMGIYNDADAEVIYLCTNSAIATSTTTAASHHCHSNSERERAHKRGGKVLVRWMALSVYVCVYVFYLKCPIKIADTLSPYFFRIPYKSHCNPSCNAISLHHGCCLFLYCLHLLLRLRQSTQFLIFLFSAFALVLLPERMLSIVLFFFFFTFFACQLLRRHFPILIIWCDVRNFTFFLFFASRSFVFFSFFFHFNFFRFRRIFHAKFHVLQIFVFPLLRGVRVSF